MASLSLDVSQECRAIKKAIQLAKKRELLEVTELNAATADDFRRVLLNNAFEIVHLAGHGDSQMFLLHGSGNGSPMPIASLRELIQRHPTVRCVILNSCHSASGLTEAIAPLTVGMDDSIADSSAIEFSRGFYDAIGAGKDLEFAVREGVSAAQMKGIEDPPIIVKRA
jgi:CHAT domain-containing protein